MVQLDELGVAVEKYRNYGHKIVWTNGCFDVLHVGHAWVLDQAKKLFDDAALVVGVNSDDSVRRIKGEQRPIFNQEDRAKLLSYMAAVDLVTIYDEPTPIEAIRIARPDVIVKGGDWAPDGIVGKEFVESYGGTVRTIPLIRGRSTTRAIAEIIRKCHA